MEAFAGLLILVGFGVFFVGLAWKKYRRNLFIIGGLMSVMGLGITVAINASAAETPVAVSTNAPGPVVAASEPTVTPSRKPKPTPTPETYEHQRQREKQELLASVDHSITASKVAGNPSKYVGDNVELRCTVSNIPQAGTINAACGDDETNIVVLYEETNALDQGQSIRILGTVMAPSEGTNAFGGAMNFPTVRADFME